MSNINFKKALLLVVIAILLPVPPVGAEEDAAAKLANPIANLISVPIQVNYDDNMGLNQDGSQWKINIQPVIPFSISDKWNIITRTILPLIDQEDIPVAGQGESGLGDIVASQFFPPKRLPPAAGSGVSDRSGSSPLQRKIRSVARNSALGQQPWR